MRGSYQKVFNSKRKVFAGNKGFFYLKNSGLRCSWASVVHSGLGTRNLNGSAHRPLASVSSDNVPPLSSKRETHQCLDGAINVTQSVSSQIGNRNLTGAGCQQQREYFNDVISKATDVLVSARHRTSSDGTRQMQCGTLDWGVTFSQPLETTVVRWPDVVTVATATTSGFYRARHPICREVPSIESGVGA
jgi:hypothetical protein